MNIPNIILNGHVEIPQLGFGTMDFHPHRDNSAEGHEITARGVGEAIEAGYRHLDTAQMYVNEHGVGKAIANSGIARNEFFIASKLSNANHRPQDVRPSFEKTLERLGIDQLDLFLLHWPLPTLYGGDFVSTWSAMIDLLESGQVRSIGVSNFTPNQLDRIIAETGFVPSVNQIELHPRFSNRETATACTERGIAVEAWSPLGKAGALDDPTIVAIATEYERTPAQVILRWHTQRGRIAIPKSSNPERMRENLDSLDFSMSEEALAKMDSLDRGESGRIGPHPDVFDWVPTVDAPRPPGPSAEENAR